VCLNCGCGEPKNRHGNQDNITTGDLQKATETAAHRAGTGGGKHDAHAQMKVTLRKGKSGKTHD
jgi:hypothetical protein